MKKIFLVALFAIFIFAGNLRPVFADSVILPDGRIVKGKIVCVVDNLIEIKTKEGLKNFTRESNKTTCFDVIEVGFLNRKKLTGKVILFADGVMDFQDFNSRMSINGLKIRDIILYL